MNLKGSNEGYMGGFWENKGGKMQLHYNLKKLEEIILKNGLVLCNTLEDHFAEKHVPLLS